MSTGWLVVRWSGLAWSVRSFRPVEACPTYGARLSSVLLTSPGTRCMRSNYERTIGRLLLRFVWTACETSPDGTTTRPGRHRKRRHCFVAPRPQPPPKRPGCPKVRAATSEDPPRLKAIVRRSLHLQRHAIDDVTDIVAQPDRIEGSVYVAAFGVGIGDGPTDLVGRRVDLRQQGRSAVHEDAVPVYSDRAGFAIDGYTRRLLESFLLQRDELTAGKHPHFVGDCNCTSVSDIGLRENLPAGQVSRDKGTRASAHHVRPIICGGEVSSRHSQVDRRIGVASRHIHSYEAGIGDHPDSASRDVEMPLERDSSHPFHELGGISLEIHAKFWEHSAP